MPYLLPYYTSFHFMQAGLWPHVIHTPHFCRSTSSSLALLYFLLLLALLSDIFIICPLRGWLLGVIACL